MEECTLLRRPSPTGYTPTRRHPLPPSDRTQVVRSFEPMLCVMTNRNYLLFRSGLFLGYQSDEDIGRWFLGGDCLGWIYSRLLPGPDFKVDCCPLMEDWGWYAAIATRDTKVRVELSLYAYIAGYWILGISATTPGLWKKPLAVRNEAHERVANAIDAITREDDYFESYGWHVDDRFDTVALTQGIGELERVANANQRWKNITKRQCPNCNALCPEYRQNCLACGYQLGREIPE